MRENGKNKKYSAELKLEIVKAYFSNKYGGYQAIADKFGIERKTLVRDWIKRYKLNGVDIFSKEMRGNGATGRPKKVNLDSMSLEEQVQYLKMENDILKKVKALWKN